MRGSSSGTLPARRPSDALPSLRILPDAQAEIRAARRRANRPAAPQAIDVELRSALVRIRLHPLLGSPSGSGKLQGVRRVFLSGTRYWLFFRVRPRAQRIDVLALWHASRGAAPPLR